MRKCIGGAWLVLASSAAWLLASGTALAADQTIDEFEAVQQAAWNAHDAGAYTARFDITAEIVTSLGWHWRGQAEAARNLGDGFKLVYAQARLRVSDVQARMLTPELASVTLRWTIDGARTIDGGRMAGRRRVLKRNCCSVMGKAGLSLLSKTLSRCQCRPRPCRYRLWPRYRRARGNSR